MSELLKQAEIAYSQLNKVKARELLDQALSLSPGDLDLLNDVFFVAEEAGDVVALEKYSQMFKESGYPYAYYLIAITWHYKKDASQRDEALALGIQSQEFYCLNWKFQMLTDEQQLDSAIDLGYEITKHFPENKEVIIELSRLLRKVGKSIEAKQLLLPMLDEGNLEAYMQVSLIEFDNGNLNEAKALTESMLKVQPENLRALKNLAFIEKRLGNVKGYLDALEKALAGDDPEAGRLLGDYYYDTSNNDLSIAERYYAKSAQLGDVQSMGSLGYIYLRTGDRASADKLLTQAVSGGGSYRFKFFLAEVRMWHNQDFLAAKALLDEVLQEEKDKSFLSGVYLDLGKYQLHMKFFTESLSNLDKARELGHPNATYWIAETYRVKGDYRRAIDWFERCDLENNQGARVGLLLSTYEKGDKRRAYSLAEKLAEEGNSFACSLLAMREAERGNFGAADYWGDRAKRGWA